MIATYVFQYRERPGCPASTTFAGRFRAGRRRGTLARRNGRAGPDGVVDDGDAAHRQGAGLAALPRPVRRRPFRRPFPRRGPRGRRLGPDAAHGQGAAVEVRRQAAVSGAEPYRLSDAEAHLYTAVTDYVREEFNRAEALANAKRAGTVGFALTILQRRLASSPAAISIYQSLRRRRERLEKSPARARSAPAWRRPAPLPSSRSRLRSSMRTNDVEDLDDAPEVEDAEACILDQGIAARSIVELKAELDTLKALESLALGVRRRSADTKWRELASLLGEIFTATGRDGRTRGAGDSRRRRHDPAAVGRPTRCSRSTTSARRMSLRAIHLRQALTESVKQTARQLPARRRPPGVGHLRFPAHAVRRHRGGRSARPRGARPACAASSGASSRLVAAGQRRRGVRDRPPAAIRAVRRPGPVQGLFGSSSQQS